jgi:DNA-binding transcriptional regulator GbsR (MarR family)
VSELDQHRGVEEQFIERRSLFFATDNSAKRYMKATAHHLSELIDKVSMKYEELTKKLNN